MTLARLLASLSLSIAEIALGGEAAALFAASYKAAPNWNDFQRLFSLPGFSNLQASLGVAFRLGRFFANQGQYLSQLDPGMILDRRLAQVGSFPASSVDQTSQYSYGVVINTYSPYQGNRIPYIIWVRSSTLLNREEAFREATAELNRRLQNAYELDWTFTGSGPEPDTIALFSFRRFTPGT